MSSDHKQALPATKVTQIDQKKQHLLLNWLVEQTAVAPTNRHSFFIEWSYLRFSGLKKVSPDHKVGSSATKVPKSTKNVKNNRKTALSVFWRAQQIYISDQPLYFQCMYVPKVFRTQEGICRLQSAPPPVTKLPKFAKTYQEYVTQKLHFLLQWKAQ